MQTLVQTEARNKRLIELPRTLVNNTQSKRKSVFDLTLSAEKLSYMARMGCSSFQLELDEKA